MMCVYVCICVCMCVCLLPLICYSKPIIHKEKKKWKNEGGNETRFKFTKFKIQKNTLYKTLLFPASCLTSARFTALASALSLIS